MSHTSRVCVAPSWTPLRPRRRFGVNGPLTLLSVWTGVCWCLHLSGTRVAAQESTAVTSPATVPDLSEFRTLLPLLAWLLTGPMMIATLFLLYQRRKHYPIAGRGSRYLMLLNMETLSSVTLLCAGDLAYPFGVPCSMYFVFKTFFSVAVNMNYMARAWVLVCRLSVQEFLAESRWREEKRGLLVRIAQERADRVDADTDACDATKIRVDEEMPADSDDPTTIPGHWFIAHRHLSDRWYVLRWVGRLSFIIVSAATILACFDPDVDLLNATFRDRHLVDESYSFGTQFSVSMFFGGPPCLVYSIKYFMFEAMRLIFGIPSLVWIVWRMQYSGRLRATRDADKERLNQLLAQNNHSSSGTSANAGHSAAATATKGIELDDAASVKRELFAVTALLFVGGSFYFPVQMWLTSSGPMVEVIIYFFTHIISVVMPLHKSYALSRRQRERITGMRRGTMIGGSSDADAYNRLPHQRPFYSLKFILRNPETYPVLLTFLQKEFSSENALFYTESRQFEQACNSLETSIPTWPTSIAGRDNTSALSSSPDVASMPGRGAVYARSSPLPTIDDTDIGGERRLESEEVALLSPGSPGSPPLVGVSRVQVAPTPLLAPAAAAVPTPIFDRAASLASVDSFTELPPASATPTDLSSPYTFGGPMQPTLHATAAKGAAAALPSRVELIALHAEANRLKTWAHTISQSYLVRSAMYEVNLPEDLMRLVSSQVTLIDGWEPTPLVDGVRDESSYPLPPPFPLSTLYKQTQLSVFELIQSDSFRRFILTPPFAQLLAEADEAELARVEKQNDVDVGTKAALAEALAALGGGSTPVVSPIVVDGAKFSPNPTRQQVELSRSASPFPTPARADPSLLPTPLLVPRSPARSPGMQGGGPSRSPTAPTRFGLGISLHDAIASGQVAVRPSLSSGHPPHDRVVSLVALPGYTESPLSDEAASDSPCA